MLTTQAAMPVIQFPPNADQTPQPEFPEILSNPALDPEVRLQLVLDAELRAREEWQDCARVADDIDPVTDPDLLENARKELRNAYRRWYEVSQQAQDLGEKFRRAKLELPRTKIYEQQYQAMLQDFYAQYESGGPQYRLLAERVAGLTIRLRQMEASGRDFNQAEYNQTNASLLSFVNQLQRFTEAQKSETVSKEAQAVAESLMAIMERHTAVTYPELWNRIVVDVRRALEGVGSAA